MAEFFWCRQHPVAVDVGRIPAFFEGLAVSEMSNVHRAIAGGRVGYRDAPTGL